MDDDDSIEMPGVPCLDRQGGLDDEDADAAFAREPADRPGLVGQDEGVDEPVQETAGRRIGEDERAQSGPVDRPVRAKDGRAEAGDDPLPGRPSGAHQGVGRLVGGIDERPFGGEQAGDDGFSAGDPSGQGDPEDPISSWRPF
jgi:hypothetical protein